MSPGTPASRRRWRLTAFIAFWPLLVCGIVVIDHIVSSWIGLDRHAQRQAYRMTFVLVAAVGYSVCAALVRWTGLERRWVLEDADGDLARIRAALASGREKSPFFRRRIAGDTREQLDGIDRYRPGDPVVGELRGYLERFERGEPLPELEGADRSVLARPTPMGPFWEDLVTGPGDGFTWGTRVLAVSALALIVGDVGASATVGAATVLASIMTVASLAALRRGQDPAIRARTGCLFGPVLILVAYMLGLVVYLLRS
jgi:hypothetical protein